MRKFKIWVEIEEVDEAADHYEHVGEPAELGQYDTLEEAEAHFNHLIDEDYSV